MAVYPDFNIPAFGSTSQYIYIERAFCFEKRLETVGDKIIASSGPPLRKSEATFYVVVTWIGD
jgi:hypothetical protein